MSNTNDKIQKAIQYSVSTAQNFNFPQEIPNGPNPLKLSKWYANEIIVISEQISRIEEECELECTCSKGCSACCQQLITVFNSEVLAMLPMIENFTKEELSFLKNKISEQCKLLKAHDIEITISVSLSNSKSVELQNEYFKLKLDCPFLNSNKECMIYHVRPLVCWSYRSYDTPQSCGISLSSPYSIKYADWEMVESKRMLAAKKSSRKSFNILQFALKDALHI